MNAFLAPSPHQSTAPAVSRLMLNVLLALVPGTLAYVWYFGVSIVFNLALGIAFAVALEIVVMLLRQRPWKPAVSDLSAVVTACLLVICLPQHAPWWLILVGVGFAMLAGKHVYGGLGFNPFNPAMVGYVALLISFPREMTQWYLPANLLEQGPGTVDSIRLLFGLTPAIPIDGVTAATALDSFKTGLAQNHTIAEIRNNPVFGDFGGVGWEWIANWWFLGGLYLLYTRTIQWRIPVALLGSLGATALVFYLFNPDATASPGFHLFSGGAMLAAFFIATDPVSASTTPKGRLIYAAGIGVLIYIIRSWGGYPDGVAFAVLIMNMFVPMIDRFTQPRVYGHGA